MPADFMKDADRGGLWQRPKDADRGAAGNGEGAGVQVASDLFHHASQLGGFFFVGFIVPVVKEGGVVQGRQTAIQRALMDLAVDGLKEPRRAAEQRRASGAPTTGKTGPKPRSTI